ncbi:hypothetical protein J1614_010593 [Plenodomus biglobosus]|nr:hypothetical protein J1614_010593 [Plenodomus biglobosus]
MCCTYTLTTLLDSTRLAGTYLGTTETLLADGWVTHCSLRVAVVFQKPEAILCPRTLGMARNSRTHYIRRGTCKAI